MPRLIKVAAAQIGAVHRTTPRSETMQRMLRLLDSAASMGAQIIVFPETAFTTFFPRYLFEDQEEMESYFEDDAGGSSIAESKNVKPLFDRARELGVDIWVGYGERTPEGRHFNTAVYYSGRSGEVLNKYRKTHVPGFVDPPFPGAEVHLEKRYFETGDLGFPAFRVPGLIPDTLKEGTTETDTQGKGDPIIGALICNDRRWPESWRPYGLQGAELVLVGFNTNGKADDIYKPGKPISLEEAREEALHHHRLVMQYNSYANSCFSISSGRCGMDDGKFDLIGGSSIVDSDGHIIAEAKTTDDEVVFAEIDLEECQKGKKDIFNFAVNRQPQAYGMITAQKGIVEPKLLSS
ncbi:carbon-nitrogen hydrolase [Phialemonium atrogriseum]|uniref:Carbon-nitrogen hydrolase n=1 Tax=Phialemonium atrogriseum TaxID=1093897 RepID=A0AAJ0BSP6_9PEZI|nr:carbon-nitrogen hydrolase [Phialemonium atrogriseum]KAK1762693.1 carbon-nitrogen hydrolase [Phialemonium atrogriseum]